MNQTTFFSRFFIRATNAGHYLENFLISAVSTILIIRFFLEITDYPQIGGGGLHIAHMLWGGLLMLIALFVVFIFLNKEAKEVGAVVGGIGFGTFIDEIGKFLTSDNNYFFQPAVALMYAVFILIFLFFRSIDRPKNLSSREYVINVLEATKDYVVHDLDEKEKKEALRLLKHADPNDQVANMLREFYEKLKNLPEASPSFVSLTRKKIHRHYLKLIENNLFIRFLIIVFVSSSLFAFLRVLIALPFFIPQSFSELGFVIASGVSGFFVVLGIYMSRTSRLSTYKMFKRAVLISIFLTQFFLFVEDQFSALLGLSFSVLMFLVLNYLIEEEKELEKDS